jgi:hypothetical protein
MALERALHDRKELALVYDVLVGFWHAPHPAYSALLVEIQSIRAVATGSMARLSHQATSSPKLWMRGDGSGIEAP